MVCVFQSVRALVGTSLELVTQHYQLCAHFPAYQPVPQLLPAITDWWDCWTQCRYNNKDSKQWRACSYYSIWITVKRLFHLMDLFVCVCVCNTERDFFLPFFTQVLGEILNIAFKAPGNICWVTLASSISHLKYGEISIQSSSGRSIFYKQGNNGGRCVTEL